jgi:hypothetical protein
MLDETCDDAYPDVSEDHFGAMDVQVLLSWFFETADPHDVEADVPAHQRWAE